MLAFAFDGDGGAAENVERSLGASEFVPFAHFSGWSDGVMRWLGDGMKGVTWRWGDLEMG